MATHKLFKWFYAIAAAIVLTVSQPLTHAIAAEALTGNALKSFITGKRIYLKAPLGGELPLFYRADGVVNGSGEALGLGRYLAPKDDGRWWLVKNRVCQKWKTWYKGKTFCFTLAKLPGNRVFWKRDDGVEGVSRIGR